MRFKSLQATRGIAASAVVAMHVSAYAGALTNSLFARYASNIMVNVGHIGVDLFFVLSGVVIASAALRSTDRGYDSTAVFLWHRLARVFPLYWLTLAAMLSLPSVAGLDNSLQTFLVSPSSLVLWKTPAAHPVCWTLTYEIQFYLAAALITLFGRYAERGFVIWIAAEVVLVTARHLGFGPRYPLTDALSLEFCMGVAICLVGRRWPKALPFRSAFLWALMIGSASLAITAGWYLGAPWVSVTTPVRAAVWGLPSAICIWSAMALEQKGTYFPQWLVSLGDMSYSIYMWHLACFAMAFELCKVASEFGAAAFVLVALVSTFAVSWVSLWYFETPVLRWLVAPRTSRAR